MVMMMIMTMGPKNSGRVKVLTNIMSGHSFESVDLVNLVILVNLVNLVNVANLANLFVVADPVILVN